jgi:signal transduction histidine kinase
MWDRREMSAVLMSPARPRGSSARVDSHSGLIAATRIAILVLCVSLQALTVDGRLHRVQLLALCVVVAVFTLPEYRTGPWTAWLAVSEAVAAAAVIGSVSPLQDVLLPYLLAPALAAGLRGGARFAVMGAGLPCLVLILARVVVPTDESVTSYMSSVSLWGALALATALLGAWVRRIEAVAAEGTATYAEVNRLLLQLRDAARHLPGSLDEVTIAQTLLQTMREGTRFSRAGVAAVSAGKRLVPLARLGTTAADLSVELAEGSVWDRAWRELVPAAAPTSLSGSPHAFCLVLPVAVGDRLVALVGVERTEAPFGQSEVNRCFAAASAAAPGLDTASLFAEVRTIATAEERRRLAREIHDGIAQELASLGYVVDDLMARPAQEPTRPADLSSLRLELTRVVTELRLSIFDLRSEVRPDTGIGEALSTYVRSVGAGSDLTVHLVLDEPRGRLRVEVEAELLRIAQEAITNARKHAGASNLWVTCRIDPPHAVLRIEDDGAGLGPRRADSYGLEIMAERAARIGGAVHFGERPGGGTLVEVIVGQPRHATRHGTAAAALPEAQTDEKEGARRVHDGAPR